MCAVNRYAAQKQFWNEQKKFQTGESLFEEDMLKKLKHAADKEKNQNDMECKKMMGANVQYGSTMQVNCYFKSAFPFYLLWTKYLIFQFNIFHYIFRPASAE